MLPDTIGSALQIEEQPGFFPAARPHKEMSLFSRNRGAEPRCAVGGAWSSSGCIRMTSPADAVFSSTCNGMPSTSSTRSWNRSMRAAGSPAVQSSRRYGWRRTDFRSSAPRAPALGGMVDEPAMDQSMRTADDRHAAGPGSDVSKHRVDFHALRRRHRPRIVRVNVPAIGRDRPRPIGGKKGGKDNEERAPVRGSRPSLPREDLVDRRQRSVAADGAEHGIALQVLQVVGPLLVPGPRLVLHDADVAQGSPDDLTHGCGFVSTKRGAHAYPAVRLEVLDDRRRGIPCFVDRSFTHALPCLNARL